MSELSRQEQLAIELLKKAVHRWPESLWLFAADGKLYVMKKKDGERVMTGFGRGVDQGYVIDEINIETDGGDWD